MFVGTPGRVHDARVFRTSPLYRMLMGNEPAIAENEHLIGDAAYPLTPFLMKPYRDNGHLTERQTRFNTTLSSVRSVIEQSFGILKSKFRRLKYLEMSRVDLIPSVIMAACVLHNIIIEDGEDFIADNVQDEQNVPVEDMEEQDDINLVAEQKRNYIASLL